MSLGDYKLTDNDVSQKGVVAAPDTLQGTAAENKRVFDRLIRDAFKGLYNGLIDALTTISDRHFKDASYNAGTHVLTFTKEDGSAKAVTIVPSEIADVPDTATGKIYRLTAENGRIVMEEV